MNNQHLMDLLVLAMNDVDAINVCDKVSKWATEDYVQVAQMLKQSIDTIYGDGSFERYQKSGILPSQQ